MSAIDWALTSWSKAAAGLAKLAVGAVASEMSAGGVSFFAKLGSPSLANAAVSSLGSSSCVFSPLFAGVSTTGADARRRANTFSSSFITQR